MSITRSLYRVSYVNGQLSVVWLAYHRIQPATPEMIQALRELRKKYVIGFVGGSNLPKIQEQLSANGSNG